MNKPAAIWARVSTINQAETSLLSQVSRCKEKLEQAGYSVFKAYSVDWTSTDLFSCPEFQQMLNLIKNHEITALAVYDRDRLEAKGLQRLIFLSELKEAGVELVICNGSPIIEGPEGQIVELALAIGKERQVMRARQGSKDGLHDRIVKYGKPATFRNPYGYKWDKENLILVPDDNYPNIKLIFKMLLDGSGYTPILHELKKRGILPPSGNADKEWGKVAISQICRNPLYAGRYFGLKKYAIEPKKRNPGAKRLYGNTSVKVVPLDEAFYMKNIVVVDPPITWEQRSMILGQLVQHQKLAQRHAKHDYLLRGLLFCKEHVGQNGEPRRYHGQPHHSSYRYTCPVGGCFLKGPQTEDLFKIACINFLCDTEVAIRQLLGTIDTQRTREQINTELKILGGKYDKTIAGQALLEQRYVEGEINSEIYNATKSNLESKMLRLEDERNILLNEIKRKEDQDQSKSNFDQLVIKYARKLQSVTLQVYEKWKVSNKTSIPQFEKFVREMKLKDPGDWQDGESFTNAEWRDIFSIMRLTATVEKESLKFSISLPVKPSPDLVGIVLDNLGRELHNQQYYPVQFSLADITTGELIQQGGRL